MVDLVVGADIGGTSTRVAVADLGGTVLSLAVGGPGNPHSVGLEGSAAQIRTVMDEALGPVAGQVVSVVVGLAGASRAAGNPDFLRAAVPQRVVVPALLVSDITAAFCSATPSRSGYVVVAGTGAVAGEVVEDTVVQQRDGWGWLLGDEGSGFWLGREAVRATLDALQRKRVLGPMQRSVLTTAGTPTYLELLQTCYGSPPTWMAQFGALVSLHAEHDPVAARIAEKGASKLAELVLSLDLRQAEPVVLAGAVLTTAGPVRTGLLFRLSARADNPVLSSTAGVIGALWIGLRPRATDGPTTHQRLVTTALPWL